MKKINIALSKLSPLALLSLLSNVIAKMTNNPNFANPAVPMSVLQAAADKLALLMDVAKYGSRQDRMQRNDHVKVVMQLIRQQGAYVVLQANGDATIQESSGYPLSKTMQPLGLPAAPQGLVAKYTGINGQVDLRWAGVRGIRVYKVFMSIDPSKDASWVLLDISTRNRYSAKNLKSETTCYFRVSAFGAAGESVQSSTVRCIAA